jgi:ABC transport system ATP-binding/permease protein
MNFVTPNGGRCPWRLFIGRSRHSDVVLSDPTVSRVHAVVWREEGMWTITDLESANGVLVNGRRVKSAVLHDGDVISLGRVRLRFGGQAAAPPVRTASRASA